MGVSMMTRQERWYQALNTKPDGYILLIEHGRARTVADELHLTNEIKVHIRTGSISTGVETLGKRIFRISRSWGEWRSRAEGNIFGPADLGYGALPGRVYFRSRWQRVWVTIISRNGIVVVGADGQTHDDIRGA